MRMLPWSCLFLSVPLVACGLERPIEQRPLVSVVDEWREQMLAANGVSTIEGEPIAVDEAELGGDFGELSWGGPLGAEATGVEDHEMVVVEVLAGGPQRRFGMAVLGFTRGSLDALVPGERARVSEAEATIIGCTGDDLFFWEFDEPAEVSTIEARVDPEDPTVTHVTFVGAFEDGTTLEGEFVIDRPAAGDVQSPQ